jgi:hypothetical protein
MINKHLVPVVFSAILFAACSGGGNKDQVDFSLENKRLVWLNSKLKSENDFLYRTIEDSLMSAGTSQTAKICLPKAAYLRFFKKDIYDFIGVDTSMQISLSLKNADTLYEKLRLYRDNVLRIDPEVYAVIREDARFITHYFDSLNNTDVSNINAYYSKKTIEEQIFILTRILNTIEQLEQEALVFFADKVKMSH